jgi:hypothetical protein
MDVFTVHKDGEDRPVAVRRSFVDAAQAVIKFGGDELLWRVSVREWRSTQFRVYWMEVPQ